MRGRRRYACITVPALVAVIALSGCGGSKSSSPRSESGASAGTITVLFGTPPDSLDPGVGYTSQALEPDSVAYVPLLTYAHRAGIAGGTLIPGLAKALPLISPDGKTYTLTLRSGLRYSNGRPVRASDFTVAVERALRIPWGGSSFITRTVAGAKAYARGAAKTVSGITTDNATGQITIRLLSPYGAFSNVLAFPAFSPVPAGTPFKNEPTSPPPGVGPYKIIRIVPGVSYSVVKNPNWRPIPGIPPGSVRRINAKISPSDANAIAVLNGSADVFDFADPIPSKTLQEARRRASSRFTEVAFPSTYYFFLNTRSKPFSSQLAREAVVVGLDRTALAQMRSGFLVAGCYLLPPTMIGHATRPCPYGDPSKPNLLRAKQLVHQSGMAGTPVTVWGEGQPPWRQFVDYYTSFLKRIGFKATERIVPDPAYLPTIGSARTHAQTGFAVWNQDFPNPIDFYASLMSGQAIVPVDNQNLGLVDDPVINASVGPAGILYKVPSFELVAYARRWQQLDYYATQRAYAGVFGYASFPKFTSSRIDYRAAVLHQVFGWDWLTLRTK